MTDGRKKTGTRDGDNFRQFVIHSATINPQIAGGHETARGVGQKAPQKIRHRFKIPQRWIPQPWGGFFQVKVSHQLFQIYVRSTDFNRTLISAISVGSQCGDLKNFLFKNFIGFFGPGTKEDYPQDLGSDWPAAYVPIAIHTISGKDDFLSPGEPDCPREKELRQLLRKTPEFQSYMGKHKWLLDFLREKGGDSEFDVFDIWKFQDVFFVEVRESERIWDWINAVLETQ